MFRKYTLAAVLLCLAAQLFAQTHKHTEDWNFYLSDRDGTASSTYLDLGYGFEDAPGGYDLVIAVTVKMKKPTEAGLSSNEESQTLYKIEDALFDLMRSSYRAIYVGRITADGKRNFYFYVQNTAVSKLDQKPIATALKDYNFELAQQADPEWAFYSDVLFPDEYQFQDIQNQSVVSHLMDSGDTLTKPRPVTHWLYFKDEQGLAEAEKVLLAQGFKIVIKQTVDDPEFAFELQIQRTDKVDLPSINPIVRGLHDLAKNNNGYYDGWECPVTK